MQIIQLSTFKDNRMNCLSILGETTIGSYLEYVEEIFMNHGGIEGQRAPLKSNSALKIRERMVDDISKGAVLPPIVMGVLVDDDLFDAIGNEQENIHSILKGIDKQNVSIIDGMQRTTSIKSALKINPELNTKLRVDIWVAKDINNLIYRMLILNTAQIPWSIKRQLEVVFNPLRKRIEKDIQGVELYSEDERSKRTHPGEYQASNIIELFLNFSIKKIHIDLKETLAEEFARLDIIESTAHQFFIDDFVLAIEYMYKFDCIYSKYSDTSISELPLNKFKKGMDLFSSHPARIGFITSISHFIYGKPGFNLSEDQINSNRETLKKALNTEIDKISTLPEKDLFEYLQFPTLDERISIKSGKIGEFEREFFYRAFTEYLTILKSDTKIINMQTAWLQAN